MSKDSAAARVAKLLDRKLPGSRAKPEPPKHAPKWMSATLVDVYAWIGPGTALGNYSELLSSEECAAEKCLFNSIDPYGASLAMTWHPFLRDATGGVTCIDTADHVRAAVIYYHHSSGAIELASSLEAYLQRIEHALSKVPDPPKPEEDDFDDEEQTEHFEALLAKELARSTKPASAPQPGEGYGPEKEATRLEGLLATYVATVQAAAKVNRPPKLSEKAPKAKAKAKASSPR